MKMSVTVRVSGDCLLPEEITAILRVTPHVARRKGEIRISSAGKEIVSKFGRWIWKSEDMSQTLPINEHINRLQVVFKHTYPSFCNLPHAENTWIDISIVKNDPQDGDACMEFLLEAKSIAILSDIGLPVEFSIY